jgi:signal transduction histidine kinase
MHRGEESETADGEVTQKAFLTGARLQLSRLQLDGDLPRLYHQVAEISAHALDVQRVGLWFFDPVKDQLRCEALFGAGSDVQLPPLRLSACPVYVSALKEHRFVATSEARHEPATKELVEYLDAWGVSSMLAAAIYRNGVVVGVVSHEHLGSKRDWKREERQFAATVADMVSHFIEVSDRLTAESQAHALALKLKDTHRLDALGHMAAGVAHDLNNLLGVLTSGLEVLRTGPDEDVIKAMADSARHASAIVAQLMAFGRKKTPVPQQLPLEQVMAEFEGLIDPHVKPGWTVAFHVEKGLKVWADVAQLHQVLSNLVLNAMQSMPSGGAVAVRAHGRHGGVAFDVIDTGDGIAEENFPRLFDPFFTTRPDGNGIGLAMVQQLVAQHGGDIKVSSTLGDGSTFRVWWPSTAPR